MRDISLIFINLWRLLYRFAHLIINAFPEVARILAGVLNSEISLAAFDVIPPSLVIDQNLDLAPALHNSIDSGLIHRRLRPAGHERNVIGVRQLRFWQIADDDARWHGGSFTDEYCLLS